MSNFKFFEGGNKPDLDEAPLKNQPLSLKLLPNKNIRYEINFHTKFFAIGQLLTNVKTKLIWLLKRIETFEDGYLVDIEVLENIVENSNPAFKDLLEFMKAFNFSTDMLVLKLDSLGNIERVLNQEELTERWETVKNDVLSPLKEGEENQELLKKGDAQYANSLPALKETLLYSVFFRPIYGAKVPFNEHEVGKQNIVSQLFFLIFPLGILLLAGHVLVSNWP